MIPMGIISCWRCTGHFRRPRYLSIFQSSVSRSSLVGIGFLSEGAIGHSEGVGGSSSGAGTGLPGSPGLLPSFSSPFLMVPSLHRMPVSNLVNEGPHPRCRLDESFLTQSHQHLLRRGLGNAVLTGESNYRGDTGASRQLSGSDLLPDLLGHLFPPWSCLIPDDHE